MSEGVAYEGSGRCLVSASPQVYILEELLSFFYGDATLQDPGQDSLVGLHQYRSLLSL